MDRKAKDEVLARAIKYFDEARDKHADFVKKVESRYKAYRGVLDELEKPGEKKGWRSTLHPPYIMHIVETTLASLVEDRRRYRVKPRVNLEMVRDPAAMQRAYDGASAHQKLHDWQAKRDRMTSLQRPFTLQNGIAGLTVAKTYWTTDEQTRRRMVPRDKPVLGPDGEPLVNMLTGEPITVPEMVEEEGTIVVYDGPTTEVRDVRDFLWHEAAVSIERSRYLIDRVWLSFEDIEDGLDGESPTFGPDRGGFDRKDIVDALKESRDFNEDLVTREQDLFNRNRTKDLIEVVEVWDNLRREVTTIANRKVLLSHRPFPFWHNKAPFVVCSTQPDLFSIAGISQVEKIAHLQDMLWTLQNQRLDNLQLINNAIFTLRDDVENADDYEFEPGAIWLMQNPDQVQMFTPNVIPAEVSLGAEGLLKGDLQNLAGGFPFSSGADSQTLDQKTATGASIVTNLAQRSINLAKQQLDLAWQDVGEQRMLLNLQFVREETLVPVTGPDDKESFEIVEPMILAGDYTMELEPSSDALMKQEEQASAQALIQLAAQAVPISQALAATGNARPLNWDAFIEDFLRAFGKENTERYFSAQPPAPAPGPTGTPGTPGAVDPAAQGITASQSIDPATSPSASISQAPVTLLQRAAALGGGGGTNV